jgi:serine protease
MSFERSIRSTRARGAAAALLAAAATTIVALPALAQDDVTRLIVKFSTASPKAALAPAARVERLADESAIALKHVRSMAVGATVVALGRPMTRDAAAALAAALARNPDVEYAQPDERRHALKVANDEFRNGQGYLDDTPGGISASLAWDVTTGSAATVVAVIDTGIRPHADLAGEFCRATT